MMTKKLNVDTRSAFLRRSYSRIAQFNIVLTSMKKGDIVELRIFVDDKQKA